MKQKLHTLGQLLEQQQAARISPTGQPERPVSAPPASEQRTNERPPTPEALKGVGGVLGSGIEPINDGPRGLLEVDDKILYAITRDTEIRNPIRATDTEIIEACLKKRVRLDTIRHYVAALNGQSAA